MRRDFDLVGGDDAARRTLGSLSAVDVIVHATDLVAVGRASPLLAPLASLSAALLGTLLAAATTWAVFGAAFYHAAHLVYPSRLVPSREWRFRALVATAGAATGIVAVRAPLAAFFPAVFGGACLVAYLRYGHGWALHDHDGQFAAVLDAYLPRRDEVTVGGGAPETTGGSERLDRASGGAACVALFTLPLVLLGMASVVLLYAYPIPELVFVGWALVGALLSALPGDRSHPDLDVGRYETDLYAAVGRSFRNTKGSVLVVFALANLLISAGIVSVGTFRMVAVSGTVPPLATAGWRTALVVVSLPTVTLGGVYGLWFWSHELRRLPAFLDRWEGKASVPPVGRVPGLLVPQAACTAGLAVTGTAVDVPWAQPPLVAFWLAVLASLSGSVVLAHSGYAPGRLDTEDRAVFAATLVWLAGLVPLGYLPQLERYFATGRLPALPAKPALLFVAIGVGLLWIAAAGDVERYQRRHGGWVATGYHAAIGAAFVGIGIGVGPPWQWRLVLLAALAGVSGLLAAPLRTTG